MEFEVFEQGAAVGQVEVDFAQDEVCAVFRDVGAADFRRCVEAFEKAVEAFEACLVGGELFVEVAEEGEGALQAVEGLDGLVHVADRGVAGKEARRLQHEGQQLYALGDAAVEGVEAECAPDDAPAVVDDFAEAFVQVAFFRRFSAKEGDAFRMFAYADE